VSFHVIGSEEIVTGFAFVGVPGTVVVTEAEARQAFADVTSSMQAGVLILTEQAAALIASEVMDWQLGGRSPLVVEIPGLEGHAADRTSLIDAIREAVGLHV
jgi:vacuolar-type H+-ATPase subunit F/Vma7